MEKEEYDEIKCHYIESVVIIIWLEKSRRKYIWAHSVTKHIHIIYKFKEIKHNYRVSTSEYEAYIYSFLFSTNDICLFLVSCALVVL